MTNPHEALAQVREALAAAVRPGEWRVSKHREGRDALIYDADDFEVARVCYPNRDANAQFIAACHPAAIRELLAERDALAVENERLRDLLRIEQDLALRNDPFRCQQIECEWFGRRVRAGDCQCHHLQATEHRAKVCKALDAAREQR